MFESWTKRQPHALTVFRVMLALFFMQHGIQKFFGFPTPFPVPNLSPLLIAAGCLELIGGALVLSGTFVHPVALLLSGEMAVAYFMYYFPKGFFPISNGGELASVFCFGFLYLAFAGAGPFSIDEMRRRSPLSGSRVLS